MSRFRAAIERFDIVQWSINKGIELRDGKGPSVYGTCPVCHTAKKLSVSRTKHIVRCFKCDSGGHGGGTWNGRADLIHWIMLVLSCNRGRALQELFANVSNLPLEAPEYDERDLNLPEEALLIGTHCNQDHPVRQYLRRRGAEKFASEWYMCPTGHYHGRIIIPVVSFGETWGFDAKSYIGGEPKSLANLRAGAIYTTREWDQEISAAIITESVLDAESFGLNSVGLFGSDLDEDRLMSITLLRRFGVTKLIWFLDGDAFDKQLGIIRKWTSLHFRNYRIRCPEGQDPNSLPLAERLRLVQTAEPMNGVFDYVDDLMGTRA